MPKVKHEWLQEIAHSFGMNVDSFAACIGYSRQRIYQAAAGKKMRWGHLQLAADNLRTLNWELREKAIQKAHEDYKARDRMVQDMLKRLGG